MASSSARTYNLFTAGEQAPTAQELAACNPEDRSTSRLIVNEYGNIALRFLGLDGRATLDESVEPPIVRFDRARLVFLFGNSDEEGNFLASNGPLDRGLAYVKGDYSGPSSTVRVSI